MSDQPPFTLACDILNLVADISQQVGRLDAGALNASPQLRKQNRIKTIIGTLAIQGNSLTEAQATAIVEGKSVLGSMRELAEAIGKDIRTIGRALAKLQQAGKVKRVGSDKTGHWEVQQ